MKNCNKCNEEKYLSDFDSDKTKKDGRATICKVCRAANNLRWRKANSDLVSANHKSWRIKNSEYLIEYRKKITELGVISEYQKNARDKNKTKNLHRPELDNIEFLSSNKKKCRKCKEEKLLLDFFKSRDRSDGFSNLCKTCDNIRRRETKNKNRDKENKVKRDYHKNKMIISDNYKIRVQMSQRLNKALVSDSEKSSIVADLGCSIYDFKNYLSSLFSDGMNWTNYGSGENKWCLDHIIPLALFNLSNKACYEKACHYSNIKPMWSIENSKKKHSLNYDNNR
jgi:hypothetical protein